MTPFSLQSMRDYMPKMLDLADQLMDKWSRLNPGEEVDVPADMTRLTLDTIALCGFGYRFNSFYRDTPHPFVEAMVRVLAESQNRMRQLPVQTRLRIRAKRQLDEDQAFMNDLVDQIIAERRAEGDARPTRPTCSAGCSPASTSRPGEMLPDENIRAQCITFLIAGHETTSGLLSFAIYYLLNNPDVLARARAEVDEVFGSTAAPTFEQVHRLRYVRQILDETLRLWPTAPGFTRQPFEDTVIGGRYAIPAHTPILVLSQALHLHTEVWGPDAAEFNPDHTAAERMTAIPPNAYKPFGTGARACIGRQFAIQEALLVLGMLVQRFEFVDHLHYELKTKTTLTIKPDDFHILVRPRDGRADRTDRGNRRSRPPRVAAAAPAAAPHVARHGTPLAVLFGSNLGTAESIADPPRAGGHRARVRRDPRRARRPRRRPAPRRRRARSSARPTTGLPRTTPPRSAGGSAAPPTARRTVWRTRVFGCGNTEWAATYQAVPTLLDDAARRARRPPRSATAARATPPATSTPPTATGTAASGPTWPPRSDLPAEVGETTAPAGPRLSITLTNRQVTQPGHRLLRGAARHGARRTAS